MGWRDERKRETRERDREIKRERESSAIIKIGIYLNDFFETANMSTECLTENILKRKSSMTYSLDFYLWIGQTMKRIRVKLRTAFNEIILVNPMSKSL